MASMFFPIQILSCLVMLLPLEALGFNCSGLYSPSRGFSYSRKETNISGRLSQEYARIRIKLLYDLSIKNKPYKGLVKRAADFWTKVLSVKPVHCPLFKSRDCENGTVYAALEGYRKLEIFCSGSCATITKCDEFKIPKEHLDGCKSCNVKTEECSIKYEGTESGVANADLVFYVTAIDTQTCLSGPIVAYAGACEFEPILDRPVFAFMNVCPKQAAQYSNDDKVMLRTIKHEMMHALGFGFDMFKLFRDKNGHPLWPRDENGQPIAEDETNITQKVIRNISRNWHVRGDVIKSERTFLVTPKVVEEVRTHFNCTDLEGAEFEEFGGEVTRLSHFEARVLYDDAMKGNMNTGKGSFSRLDFAVLEDSGWYQVDYSQAETMQFGSDLGCDFCKKSCKFWMDKRRKERKSIEPFCDIPDFIKVQHFTCNGTKKLFSGCPLRKYDMLFQELPQRYQNFDKISGVSEDEVTKYGSVDELADFCPIPIQNFDVTAILDGKIDCDVKPIPAEKPKPAVKPKPAEKPKTAGKPKPSVKPKPTKESQDKEVNTINTNQSSRSGSSVLLVTLIWTLNMF